MAANTISGRHILFHLAQSVGELKSAWVTARTSDTVFQCGGIETDANDDDFYNYGLMRVADGSPIVLIADYNGTTKQFTVGSGLTIAVGTRVEFCWSNAKKRAAAMAAVNEAIREAYPFWYRERVSPFVLTGTVAKTASSATLTGTNTLFAEELSVGDTVSVPGTATETGVITAIASNTSLTVSAAFANSASGQTATRVSGITLTAGDDDYKLPVACDALIAVGVGANPVQWIPAVEENGRVNYRVEGQPGALLLRVMEKYAREGSLADAQASKALALHYATREPEIAETDATCQLPLDYFKVAALAYQRHALNDASRLDLATASVNIPQIQQAAQVALSKLGIGKNPPSLLVAPPSQDKKRPPSKAEGE